MDWEYIFARIKRYFLRIAYALCDKNYGSHQVLTKAQQKELDKRAMLCSIYIKARVLMQNGKMQYLQYDGKVITSSSLLPQKYDLNKSFKIHEKYLNLFVGKEREFVKNELIYMGKQKEVKTIKRSNGKDLKIQITQHARERFVSRTLLIKERLPNFNFPHHIRPQIPMFQTWIEEKIKEIDIEDKIERDRVLQDVASEHANHLDGLILECLKHSTYSNEKSKHYKYRDKKGNTNYYRFYPYTFVFNSANNCAMTTEIYAIAEESHNRNDLVIEINTKTYNLFDNYIERVAREQQGNIQQEEILS